MKHVYLVVQAMVADTGAAHALARNLADACGEVGAEDVRVEYRAGGAAWAWPDALPGDLAEIDRAEMGVAYASKTAKDLAEGAGLPGEAFSDFGSPSNDKGYTSKDVRAIIAQVRG